MQLKSRNALLESCIYMARDTGNEATLLTFQTILDVGSVLDKTLSINS